MRAAAIVICLLVSPFAVAAPAAVDMGAWDCQGSKPREVAVAPGTQAYVWKGECSGAEGFDVVIEPESKALSSKMTYDRKTKELRLEVSNKTTAPVRVKMHVFVGFA